MDKRNQVSTHYTLMGTTREEERRQANGLVGENSKGDNKWARLGVNSATLLKAEMPGEDLLTPYAPAGAMIMGKSGDRVLNAMEAVVKGHNRDVEQIELYKSQDYPVDKDEGGTEFGSCSR